MTTERLHRGVSLRDRGVRTQTDPQALGPDLSAPAMLPHCAATGATGPLTLAVRAKLQNELLALQLPVGRVVRFWPYLFPAAVAIFSLIFLPSLLGWAKKTLLRRMH